MLGCCTGDFDIKSLFLTKNTSKYKAMGLGLLAGLLMVVDQATSWLDQPRAIVATTTLPIIWLANFPGRISHRVGAVFVNRGEMKNRIAALEAELLLLKTKSEKMAVLVAENQELRNLLGSAKKRADTVLVAELVGINPDPQRQQVTIDKGSVNGVFVGQPVIDSHGLLGQVVEVSHFAAQLLLVNDPSHAVPVQVTRSGLRLIAQGAGLGNQLELLYVHASADIRVGDNLHTSGLAGRFPAGYPVGVVQQVEQQPGQAYVRVIVQPVARLSSFRHALLVFTDKEPTQVAASEGGR